MKKGLFAIFVLLFAAGCGYLVYVLFSSDIAAYIVAVAGSAAGLSALFVSLRGRTGTKVKSKVKVGQAEDTIVRGVEHSGKASIPEIEAEVQIDKIKRGEVTGVRAKETKD